MNRLFYPAVFHKAEEGGFWVTFPDIPECMTQGEDMQEAYEMSVDALGLALTARENEKEPIPEASALDAIDPEDGTLVIVEFDMAEYRRANCSRAVKKTLSIPEWLNEAAIRENINFSQILQEALGLRHLAFKVKSVDDTVKELNGKGIETEPVRLDDYTGKKMTFFHDPDGLPLEIHE